MAVSPVSFAVDDLTAFGVRSDSTMYVKNQFEQVIEHRISERLKQFVDPTYFQVHVEVDLSRPKPEVSSSTHLQLGMLGTVVSMSPPRQRSSGSRFIDRINQLRITIFASEDLRKQTADRLLDLAVKQISFLPRDLIMAEVKTLQQTSHSSYALLKDFQIIWSILFMALVIFLGFRMLGEKMDSLLLYAHSQLGSDESQRESVPAPIQMVSLAKPRRRVISEDHFFKLPFAVRQAVTGFTPLSHLQEIFALLSPEYKKLFWACLPSEFQTLPEDQFASVAHALQAVEASEGWRQLSNNLYKFVARNSKLVSQFHADIRFYFEKDESESHENAS